MINLEVKMSQLVRMARIREPMNWGVKESTNQGVNESLTCIRQSVKQGVKKSRNQEVCDFARESFSSLVSDKSARNVQESGSQKVSVTVSQE